jgi:hypothetical protein
VPGRTAVPAVLPGILPGAGALETQSTGPFILAVGSCHGTGTGWDTRRDRRDACSPLMLPHPREPQRSGDRLQRRRSPAGRERRESTHPAIHGEHTRPACRLSRHAEDLPPFREAANRSSRDGDGSQGRNLRKASAQQVDRWRVLR